MLLKLSCMQQEYACSQIDLRECSAYLYAEGFADVLIFIPVHFQHQYVRVAPTQLADLSRQADKEVSSKHLSM